MKRLLVSILLAVGAFAQSYPGSIYVPPVAADNVATTLSSAMAAIDTAAVVTSGTGWAANMLAYICDGTQTGTAGKCTSTFEIMKVTGVSGNVLTVTRAQGGTSAIAHAKNKAIYNAVTSPYVNLPSTEIAAIETALGPNLVNVLNSGPTVNAATYNFSPQTPGGSLIVGNTSVTMTPVPGGVNGSDSHHYLYVSGGTGTAEACLITGGAGTGGQTSGTIIINCAHTHSGAWTIQSASAGIVEAASAISNAGTVTLPRAAMNIYFTMVLPTAVSLKGQSFSMTGSTLGSILICAAAANPCLMIADGLGTATGQGFGIHADYYLYGSGTGTGLWLGGDPASVLTPTAWTGSYLRFYNVLADHFVTALYHRRGNFVTYNNCAFSGTTRAIVFPSDGNGEHQPVDFYGTLATVPTGAAVQMDDSGFSSTPVEFHGGQVSGALTGTSIFWESFGTHYEPNETNAGILTVTSGGAIVKMTGGIMAVHGTALTSMLSVSGTGFYQLTVRDVQVQDDVGMTVTNLVSFATSLGGALRLSGIDIAAAGTLTNLYTISKATLDAATKLEVTQQAVQANTGIAAGATTTFLKSSYPMAQLVSITGGTVGGSGITAVAGLTAYQTGSFITTSVQTFTSGATIGNTVTTTAGLPYNFFFDGTKIWIN